MTDLPADCVSTSCVSPVPKFEILELWRKYEDIAMHFNDLIVKIRIQALGGVAAVTTIVSLVVKEAQPLSFRWGLLTLLFIFLMISWVAIWVLDFTYYHRLLRGAVKELIRLEEASKRSTTIDSIAFSTTVREAVQQNERIGSNESTCCKDYHLSGRHGFYILIFLGLAIGFWFCAKQYLAS